MATEAIPLVVSILDDNWTRANTDNSKPGVTDITTGDPERVTRIDLSRSDYVLLYETAHNEEAPELFYDFVNTRVNLTIDCRTSRGRSRLEKIEDELRRVIHLKRKGDATNYDRLLFKTRTDLSDRTKRMHRMTFQVEVVTLAEAIA